MMTESIKIEIQTDNYEIIGSSTVKKMDKVILKLFRR